MRALAVITLLLATVVAAPAQETAAGTDDQVQALEQRIAALEASQAALVARIQQLEAMRVKELRTLLQLYERNMGGPTAGNSPAAPSAAPVTGLVDAIVQVPAEPEVVVETVNGTDGADDADGADGAEPAASAAEPVEEQSPVAAFIQTARTMIDEQSFAAALRILNVAIDLEPQNDEAYFYRGVARHLLRRYEESMDDFQTAFAMTESASMRYTCLYNQACVLALTGQVDKCLEYLQRSYEEGFQDIVMQMATDPDLDGVRGNRGFRDLLWKLKNP